MKSSRNSSIELLKIIAVVMIVFSHSIQGEDSLTTASLDVSHLVLLVEKYFGQLGNDIFVVASSWFLLESKRVSPKKALGIVFDSFLISVLLLIAFSILGENYSALELLKKLMPITMNTNWFIGCYLIFYLIHPLLNAALQSINKKQLLACNLMLGLFYCCIQTAFRDRYYYTQVVGFICIYFFVAYMKENMKIFQSNTRKNWFVFTVSMSVLLLSIFAVNYLGIKVSFLRGYVKTWSVITNPFMIVIALSLFNIFRGKQFTSKVTNYLSSLSLLVYLFHTGLDERSILSQWFFSKIYVVMPSCNAVLSGLLFGILLLLVGTVLSVGYKETLQRITKYIASDSEKGLKWVYNLIYSYIDKLD